MYINFIKFIYVIEDLWSLKQEILRNLSVGVINIEYENIKFENGNIEKQSGELNEKVGKFSVNCWDNEFSKIVN